MRKGYIYNIGILGGLYNIYHNLSASIKFSKLFRIITAASTVLLLVLSYTFFNPTSNIITSTLANIAGGSKGVHAEGTPTASSAPLASLVTLNIDLTHPNASVELTPHDSTGAFSSSSEDNSVAFNVSTNNYTGYTLYLSSSSNDGYLSPTGITTPTTENSLSSIEQVTTESDFSSTSSTNLNNKWGYKPSKYNGSDNTSFIPAPSITNPTTNSAILDTTTTYNTTTNGDPITSETNTEDIDANTYTIALGARVDSTIPTGSYEGTFVLQVVGNPVPVTITYTDTSGDTSVTSTLPAKYEGEVAETRSPISTTTPTRTGYTFKSWCLGEVTAGTSENNYVDTCTGTTYNPSTEQNTQYIGVDLTHSNTMTLVAMWERNKYTQIVQVRYQGTDGNYGNYSTYNACTVELYYGDTHSCSIAATTEYKAASVASYTVTGAATKQMDVARQTYTQTVQYRNQNADGTYGSYTTYSTCTKAVYYGASHSCSIAADTTYAAASLSSYTVSGTATKQFNRDRNTRTVALSKGTGIASVSASGTGIKSTSGTAYTVYYGGAINITASPSSNYIWVDWTGTRTYQNISSSITNVTSNLSLTANGKACSTSVSGTLQAFAPCSSIANGTTGTLKDSRDNQTYTVKKLADGRWWMIENLRLGASSLAQSLSASNTNMDSTVSFTLPSTSVNSMGSKDDGAPRMNATNANALSPLGYQSGQSAKRGVYYNYCTASAGTICDGGSNNSDATNDICPKGWRLPTHNTNKDTTIASGEIYNLRSKYSSDFAFQMALKVPLAGYYNNDIQNVAEVQGYSTDGAGGIGRIWSSTRHSSSYYMSTSFDFDSIRWMSSSNRSNVKQGLSMRCIKK